MATYLAVHDHFLILNCQDVTFLWPLRLLNKMLKKYVVVQIEYLKKKP